MASAEYIDMGDTTKLSAPSSAAIARAVKPSAKLSAASLSATKPSLVLSVYLNAAGCSGAPKSVLLPVAQPAANVIAAAPAIASAHTNFFINFLLIAGAAYIASIRARFSPLHL